MNALRLAAAIAVCGAFGTAPATAAPSGVRLWQFTSGQTITAQYLWSDREAIYLKATRGKELRMPVGLLANADLELVRSLQATLQQQGILYEAPLVWAGYHSKNLKSLDADRAGVYPLDSQEKSMGKLELEFTLLGAALRPGPGRRIVLRLTTANRGDAGTNSAISVVAQGQLVGSISGVAPDSTFDIPLAPSLFNSPGALTLSLTCGDDTVHLRSGKSGAGPRLLLLESKPE